MLGGQVELGLQRAVHHLVGRETGLRLGAHEVGARPWPLRVLDPAGERGVARDPAERRPGAADLDEPRFALALEGDALLLEQTGDIGLAGSDRRLAEGGERVGLALLAAAEEAHGQLTARCRRARRSASAPRSSRRCGGTSAFGRLKRTMLPCTSTPT